MTFWTGVAGKASGVKKKIEDFKWGDIHDAGRLLGHEIDKRRRNQRLKSHTPPAQLPELVKKPPDKPNGQQIVIPGVPKRTIDRKI